MRKMLLRHGLVAITLVFLAAGGVWLHLSSQYPEAATIAASAKSSQEISESFVSLVLEKGPEYSFAVLDRAEIPSTVNLHGIAHDIAGVLYEQSGASTLYACPKQYQPACGHEFAQRLLSEFSIQEGVMRYDEACDTMPRETGEYAGCYHGLGHGLMEALSYSLADVAPFCRGTDEEEGVEYTECMGGAMMELLRGGPAAQKNNPPEWYAARKKHLSPESPLSYCFGTAVPLGMREQCLSLSGPWILESAGFERESGLDDGVPEAFKICEAIGSPQQQLQAACYRGIGTELALIEGSNEIARVSDYDAEALQRMERRCKSAEAAEGQEACLAATAAALSRAENKHH